MYENQNEWVNKPVINEINVVWINKISPIAKGWFVNIKIKLKINVNVNNINWKMQEIV